MKFYTMLALAFLILAFINMFTHGSEVVFWSCIILSNLYGVGGNILSKLENK